MRTETVERDSKWLPYLSVVGLLLSLMVVIILHRPLFWAMGIGAAIAFVSALRYPATEIEGSSHGRTSGGWTTIARVAGYARDGMSRIFNVIVLIILVNGMTAVWFASGTIQGIVYYGLLIVHPGQVMVAGLIVATFVSLMLGSSVGTVATVGVAVMGIAKSLGLPLAPVAGAIMSGAVFGDRVSFLSPIFHLTVDLTGSDRDKASKRIMYSGIAAWCIAFILYLAMGMAIGPGSSVQGLAARGQYLEDLRNSARLGLWVMLPPLLVILLALRKVPVRICLTAGLVAGIGVAAGYQGNKLFDILKWSVMGFKASSAAGGLATLLRSGGIIGTRDMVLLLLCAGAYTGITASSGMMDAVVGPLVASVRSRVSFLLSALVLSVLSACFASNQAMSVVLPARLMESKRKEVRVSPEDFAGALSDSGVPFAGIIPWNVMAAICAQSLQISPVVYGPYSFFLLALPLVGASYAVLTEKRAGHRRESDHLSTST